VEQKISNLAGNEIFITGAVYRSFVFSIFREKLRQRFVSSLSTMASDDPNPNTKDDDDDDVTCPLFMEGLPSDFSKNPQLAALASLLEEDDKDDNEQEARDLKSKKEGAAPQAGGGKVRSVKTRQRRKAVPYPAKEKKPSKKEASVSEAHLFLKMWKL
jgi:hypothetical protein